VCTASCDEAAQAALVVAAAHGSIQAFEALYRIYHPRLARFLERRTHRPQLAEELLDDTMLTVWHKARTYNGHSKVSTWIFAIAYRKALKARKRLDDPVSADPDAEETSATPEGELLQLESRAHQHGRAHAIGRATRRHPAQLLSRLRLSRDRGYR
jgi:RNA polymerase sigma-70 factor (ECF subfamily)